MRRACRFLVIGGIMAASAGPARAWQTPEVAANDAAAVDASGGQVLTQGPIHEAFAQPVLFDPKPSPVVPKAPPAPINELPPDQKPVGENVQWIPGYWAWDDSRSDFVWVSGVWRAVPQGRQWVPGYWNQADGGAQWVPGYWGATDAAQVQYLAAPPASLEHGPNSPPPSADATWAPGAWAWQGDQYQWRPGFWVQNQPNWMWSPASTSWTPNGYVYNQGFWDYPLASRGQPFAPVYFNQGVYNRPNFAYTPGVGLLSSALMSSMFVRPASHSYLFGDYYGASNYGSGIYPGYAFHNSRYGYDPLYAYSASQNALTNPRWANELHDVYQYRLEHPEARPLHTFAETRNLAAQPDGPNATMPANAANLVLARPFSQLTSPVGNAGANANAMRFERIEEPRRRQIASQAAEINKFREERARREQEASRNAATGTNAAAAPRSVEMTRSPVAAVRPSGPNQAAAPPAMPKHPEFDRAARPVAPNAAPLRHEPLPETRPPAPHPAAAQPAPGAPAAAPRAATPAPALAPAPAPAPATEPAPKGAPPRRK